MLPSPFSQSLSLSLFFLSLLVSSSLSVPEEQDKFENFQNHASLSQSVELYWTVDTEREDILIGLKFFEASGWVGFGLSQTGSMKGSDMIVLRKDEETQEFVLEDRFATEFALPSLDQVQNVYLFWAFQDESRKYTEVIFSRPLASCDGEDRPIGLDAPSVVLYAFGESHTLGYHGSNSRGVAEIDWTGKKQEQVDKTETLILRIPEVEIPEDKTTYMCVGFDVPVTGKHHLISVAPLLESRLVHHMVVFHCSESQPTDPWSCPSMSPCGSFWIGWGVGQSRVEFPPVAGIPVGMNCGANESCGDHLVLQIHYDNPSNLVGEKDSSGLELVITENLREFDIGTMTVGVTPNLIAIPPKTENALFTSFCPGSCSQKWFQPQGVHLISVTFHMHQVGTSIETRHIRDGKALEPLGNITHWDFNAQSHIAMDKILLPGDSFETRCTYSTMNRVNVTRGGEGSQDEMCFAFLRYYPKNPIQYCFDLRGYTDVLAFCSQDQISRGNMTREEWMQLNTSPMGPKVYENYIPPEKCACSETCWVPPTRPDWLMDEEEESSSSSLSRTHFVGTLVCLMFLYFISLL